MVCVEKQSFQLVAAIFIHGSVLQVRECCRDNLKFDLAYSRPPRPR